MKKLCCIVALAAISFGAVCSAAPVTGMGTIKTDTTTKIKKKKMKVKTDTSKMKMKMKKDTTKM